MLWRVLLVLIAALVILMMPGCKKKTEPATPSKVKITEENLDDELDKMEAQIEADIAAEE